MKIRTRLTLWYAVILFVSLSVIGFGTYREIAEQLMRPEHHHSSHHALDETSEMVFQVGLPAVLLGMLGGWWLMRKALAPVTALTRAAEKINDSNLCQQIPRSGNGDELDRLTEVFNAMTTRLDGSFQRIREFTLHASHELKTPLTVLRGELEISLGQTNLNAEQRERVSSQIDEIDRLATIVDGLTLLTKADAGQVTLQCETIALDELVQESFNDAKILAQPHNIQVSLGDCDKITVRADRHRLRQTLLNLADNSVKYNRPGGEVQMSLRRMDHQAEFKIANTGPGVPPELQSRVFERFFRGDASHGSTVEGCGLGLSVVQWIVSAHGGLVQFVSAPDKLTTVTVLLPISLSPAVPFQSAI